MTRDKLLEYITDKHKAALTKVGLESTDAQETLFHILNDAMNGVDAAAQKTIADREVETLIQDRKAMAKEEVATEKQEDTSNVSIVRS